MKIDWPINERPREKLLTHGAQVLSDVELLALFLQTGTKDKSVMEVARDLTNRFGSLSAILDASNSELCKSPGVGKAKYVLLQATLELYKRYLSEHTREQSVIKNPEMLQNYLQLRLKPHQREILACLFLGPNCNVIHYEELFMGTLTQVPIYPREIAKIALSYNAHSVVMAHNHPQGKAKPSDADRFITQKTKEALALLDIELADHVIISPKGIYSFVQHGLLQTNC